jgi:hypothetical protein
LADENTESSTVATTATTTAAAATTTTTTEQVIYCGPTLPAKYGLQQYTVFKGGIPDHIQSIIKDYAPLGVLIVDVEKLGATKAAINTTGTVEAVTYKNIVKKFRMGA